MNKKSENTTSKTVGVMIVIAVLSIGFLWLGKWIAACACDRWVSTEGFWQATLANFQLGIAEAILGMAGNSFSRVGKQVTLKARQNSRVFLVGAVVVFVLGLILLRPFVGIADELWWTGVFNTVFALHIYLALGTFAASSFAALVMLIKKS